MTATGSGGARPSAPELLDRSPAALLAISLHGTVLAHSAPLLRWLGAPETPGILGQNLVGWLSPASRLLYKTRVIPQLLETGRVREVVLEARDRSGARRPVLVNAELRVDDAGERVVYIAAVDAAGRVAFEQELVEARRAAGTAHDRLELLQDATSRLAVARGLDDLGETLVAAATRATHASWVSVRVVDHERADSDAAVRAWGAAPPGVPDDEAPGSRTSPTVCRDPGEIGAALPGPSAALREAGVEALVVTPILRGDDGAASVVGEIRCWFRRPRTLDDDELDTLRSIAVQAERVVEHLRLQERLRHHALHDALTGLPNRLLFEQRLEQQLEAASRSGDACAVLFVDLDGFKGINDELGHATGDEVLRTVAGRLRRCCRAGDTVSRLGGDEFVIAASGVGPAAVEELARRVWASLRAPLDGAAAGAPLSGSVGALHWTPEPGSRIPSAEELSAAADAAMYEAKRSGKDRVVVRPWRG